MAGEWWFGTVDFDFIYADRVGPEWKPDVDATERRLIGTSRVERTWRSTRWTLQGEAFIANDDDTHARVVYESLRYAFASSELAVLTDGVNSWNAVLIDFQIVPLYNGADGYRGSVTFLRPEG